MAAAFPDGCAVGALACELRDVQAVRCAVDAAGWLKGAGSIVELSAADLEAVSKAATCDPGERSWRKAVHLSPLGAAALDAGVGVPAAIGALLADRRALWVSGIRQPAPAHERRVPAQPGAWFTFAELFAGIGGFRLGLEPLGGECVFASEVDPVARRIYEHNHGDVPAGDITGIPSDAIGPHDVLTAGFPCQPFSQCGEQPGMLDRRGQLFYEVIRVARFWRPKLLLLENVSNLANTNGGLDYSNILGALADAGYTVRARVLNSAALLAQRRNRLYFVALRSDLCAAARAFAWPELATGAAERTGGAPPRACVASILQPAAEVGASYTLVPHLWAGVCARERDRKTPLARRLVRLEGVAGTLMSSYRRAPQIYSQFVPPAAEAAAVVTVAEGAQEAAAEGAQAPAALPPPPRFFTERECCRLQGFDDSFKIGDHGQVHRFYHCIGNAVCPPVVCEIGKAALRALLDERAARGEGGSAADGAGAGELDALFPRLGAPQSPPAVPYPCVWKRQASVVALDAHAAPKKAERKKRGRAD